MSKWASDWKKQFPSSLIVAMFEGGSDTLTVLGVKDGSNLITSTPSAADHSACHMELTGK